MIADRTRQIIRNSIAILIACFSSNVKAQVGNDLNIGAMVQPVPENYVLRDTTYFIWGASVVKGHDKKYHMFYSRWPKEVGFSAWVTDSEIAYAVADKPEEPTGPFRKLEGLIFYKEGKKFPAEDPYIWYQHSDDRYYAIVKDMKGTFTNAGTSLAFFKSNDGLNWEPAQKALVSGLDIHWEDGNVQRVGRLERPQVLIENGQPGTLYCAVLYNRGGATVNVHIPLKREESNK
ncbi:glycoside hydrolase family protein [Fulvivirgaceae bacterium BMA10]|uniref:Glycoside hydrolase family protein n=1 Tax=Splendidivirga corallicola TaxID=3051826 RepID=A0ABT8KHV9_9BACT|nr:glycoside hydrolase family protein [Fulvivirgaceae bacterium BMA10]